MGRTGRTQYKKLLQQLLERDVCTRSLTVGLDSKFIQETRWKAEVEEGKKDLVFGSAAQVSGDN